jgi:hypothetical protein
MYLLHNYLGTQLLVYADAVNILGDNTDTIKKNTQTLIDACKEIGLEVNTEKTKYMSLSSHQNAGQNHYIKIDNRWFENVTQFTYLGTTITNENLIQEEIKRRSNSGSDCYHSVQNLLFFCLLSKNIKVRICKTRILPVVLCGCETWSLILREEHRLMVFENRVLRRIFGPKGDEETGDWRKLHNEDFLIFTKLSNLAILATKTSQYRPPPVIPGVPIAVAAGS